MSDHTDTPALPTPERLAELRAECDRCAVKANPAPIAKSVAVPYRELLALLDAAEELARWKAAIPPFNVSAEAWQKNCGPATPALPTPELIAKLRRLANAATPGPWAPDSVMSEAVNEIILDYPTPEAGCPVVVASTYDDEYRSPTAGKGEANCRFLSACDPQTVLSLVAAAERLAKAERDVTFLADKVIPKLEDRLREVAEIAEGLYRRDRYTVVGFDRRWLAIRDAVLPREEARRAD